MSLRITQGQIPGYRRDLLAYQGGRCLLCTEAISSDEAVLDHCHTTGEIRGVLHRGCNAMLGHIENNMPRHKLLSVPRLAAFLANLIRYMHWNSSVGHTGLIHPTHKTDDEKRELRNKRARKARKKAKENA